jgi:hypothetical protein
MTAALDRDRLAKVLSLLASPSDGEVLAAGRTAVALLQQAGTTWAALLAPPHSDRLAAMPDSALLKAAEAVADGWDREFVQSLARLVGYGHHLTTPQRQRPAKIAAMEKEHV